jgi:UDP-N-acetylglucosamine 2-epimerase (non-hydrolysing)
VKNLKINKVLIVFGTRPEAIKMAPVVIELRRFMNVRVCVTAQHREMLDQVLDLFEITPDYDLNIMAPGQDLFDITSGVLLGMKKVISKVQPDLVMVHGDTSTAMATSTAAFYLRIPVAHIEAGLRTNDIYSPFPEEFNRQVISRIAFLHFSPTEASKSNLTNENINEKSIYVTGNTVIDSLLSVIEKTKESKYPDNLVKKLTFLNEDSTKIPRIILVTGHRRENFGSGFEEICLAIKEIASQNPKVQIIYPVHLNPNVSEPVNRILIDVENVHLIEPLDYLNFVKLMNDCYLILTDSGGIQEEAPSLGKPVIVMRQNTERTEALKSGTVVLVGSNKEKIIETVNGLLKNSAKYKMMSEIQNPYGDGLASKRIFKILSKESIC